MCARQGWPVLALFAAALALAPACASPTQNVRAYRAYAGEQADIRVSIDRVEDLARCLELVDRLLSGTTYTPGDQWPKRLALGAADARRIRAQVRDEFPYNRGDFEVPLVKIYRVYLESVLRDYGPPPEKARYASLIEAIAALAPGVALQQHWQTYRDATARLSDAVEQQSKLKDEIAAIRNDGERRARDPEFDAARLKVDRARAETDAGQAAIDADTRLLTNAMKLDSPEKQKIARDAVAALSVALRVTLEAAALVPVIIVQTVRSLPTAPRDLTVKPTLKTVRAAWHLPVYLIGIQEHYQRTTSALTLMTAVLAKGLDESVNDTPGFELRESIVDQIVGITIDSFRLDLNGAGSAFFFNSIGVGDRQSSSDGKTTFDYRGRRYQLLYKVSPIVLAAARLDVSLDWIRMPDVANVGFGYATDRVYRSGGAVESTALSEQLGLRGAVSDVVDASLGILGVRTGVRVATWTTGHVEQVDATNVKNVVARVPLQLSQTQVDVGYDVLWAIGDARIRSYMEELVVGGRYLHYSLPRIVYELRDVSTVSGERHYVFDRESPPQVVASQFWLAGATARFGQGEAPRWSPFLDIGAYFGAGPTSFYFLRDPALPDATQNRDVQREAALGIDAHAALGLRWRLLPRAAFMRLELRALYQADGLYAKIHSLAQSGGQDRATDFGAFDLFHGPALALRGSL